MSNFLVMGNISDVNDARNKLQTMRKWFTDFIESGPLRFTLSFEQQTLIRYLLEYSARCYFTNQFSLYDEVKKVRAPFESDVSEFVRDISKLCEQVKNPLFHVVLQPDDWNDRRPKRPNFQVVSACEYLGGLIPNEEKMKSIKRSLKDLRRFAKNQCKLVAILYISNFYYQSLRS